MAEKPQFLPIKGADEAVEEAKALIESERSGRITGLYCRWLGVNRAKFKYWRFGNVTMIAGMSGSGKSAILNMLEDDFMNPLLNPAFLLKHDSKGKIVLDDKGDSIYEPKIMILAFKFEMDAASETLRCLSGRAKKSYAYLLSSQIDKEKSAKEGKEVYNLISDEEYSELCVELDKLKRRPIKFVENSGNIEQIWNTSAKFKERHPDKQLIITLDHKLLTEKLSEKDDLQLVSNIARLSIRLKKAFNALVIIIGQLNGEIEKTIRRDTPLFHYPVKTDIHCGNQIYWACDDVVVFHRPEKLNILKYGQNPSYSTLGLIHCSWLKGRLNGGGNVWFKEKFSEGHMEQISPKTMEFKAFDKSFDT